MVQLRSCYFCGTTAALAEYETVPERLRTDPSDGRTVVLCDRCRGKLRSVLDPLVDRVDATGATATVDDGTTQPVGSEGTPADGADSAETAGDGAAVETADNDADASDSEVFDLHDGRRADADQTNVTFDTGETDVDTSSAAETDGVAAGDDDAGAGSNADAGADALDQGDPTGADDEAGTEEAAVARPADEQERDDEESRAQRARDESEGVASTESPDDGAVDGPLSGDADDAADEQSDAGGGSSVSPMTYYKLLRFLRNRELPMPRSRAEALVSGAYDLSERDTAELIDLAIDRDALVETDGHIDRT